MTKEKNKQVINGRDLLHNILFFSIDLMLHRSIAQRNLKITIITHSY